MLPLQDPGVDVGDLVKKLINGLVVFFFIGLPIVKSILESRKQEKEKRRRSSAEPTPTVEEPARPSWEELLRGDVHSAPPPVVPPPIPQPMTRVPSTGSLVDLESSAPPMLSEDNLEEEGASDEEALAEEAIARREREELARQHEIARRQRAAGSSLREAVEPVYTAGVDLSTARGASIAPAMPARALARARVPRRELARAVVMAEILGPPMGLDPLGERRASRPLAM